MSIAARPSPLPTDIRARRAAALERLQGGERRTRTTARPTRARRTRRERLAELGPVPSLYYFIVAIVAVFVMLGLVMVLSATSAARVGSDGSPYGAFRRQAVWAGIGLVGMRIVMAVPYQRMRRFVVPVTVVATTAMALPFVPGLGVTINGATSWVWIGPFSVQPSEFLKLAAIGFLADFFARHRDTLHRPRHGLIPLVVVAGVTAGASFAQGDLGSAIVLAAVVLAVGVIAEVPFGHVMSITAVGALGVVAAIMSDPRRFNRLAAFRDIEGNKEDLAFQSWQGLLSIANGGLTGTGIGGGNSKLGYVPLAHSDFIFAVVAEELGFVGSAAVIVGFVGLVLLGVQAALAAPDQFGAILAGGVSVWFGVQAIVNLGGVAGLIPVTGLTLPFFSAGGTSLVVSMVAAGLLLNVARRAVTDTGPRRQVRSHR